MERKPRDTYRIECNFALSDDGLVSLMSLYQPLIGGEGILIYLTLIAESRKTQIQETHARLFALINIQADVFDRACAKLEEYMLMRTYLREGDAKNNYIYVLHAPLSPSDFFSAPIYANRYTNQIGKKQADATRSRLMVTGVSKSGFKDITREVRFIQEQDYDNNVSYTEIKPRYQFAMDDVTINFDYDTFIKTTSTLVFPAELRTPENMALIGKLATVYGLSPDRMRIFMKDCIMLNTMEFDAEKLRILASKAQSDVPAPKDVYSLSPVSFLQAKQNGAKVSLTDRKILEHLAIDMHFSNEVINVMIEYILKISDNRLNSKFVDMVAAKWARDGIENKKMAIAETKKDTISQPKNNIRISMPSYMQSKPEDKDIKASDEMIERIRKLQEQMKE